jgi:hypothetical protein
MPVINRFTGQPPTEQEQKEIDTRAREIFSSPYSAPELVEWALMCASIEVSEEWMFAEWESCREKGIRERRQSRMDT